MSDAPEYTEARKLIDKMIAFIDDAGNSNFIEIEKLITAHTEEAYRQGYIAGGIVELTIVRGRVEYIHADTVNDRIIELEKDK